MPSSWCQSPQQDCCSMTISETTKNWTPNVKTGTKQKADVSNVMMDAPNGKTFVFSLSSIAPSGTTRATVSSARRVGVHQTEWASTEHAPSNSNKTTTPFQTPHQSKTTRPSTPTASATMTTETVSPVMPDSTWTLIISVPSFQAIVPLQPLKVNALPVMLDSLLKTEPVSLKNATWLFAPPLIKTKPSAYHAQWDHTWWMAAVYKSTDTARNGSREQECAQSATLDTKSTRTTTRNVSLRQVLDFSIQF